VTAYVLAEVDIRDPATYDRYRARTPEIVARYGGRFVIRGGDPEWLEGTGAARIVLIAFPDRAAARRFHDSPEYREIVGLRWQAAESRLAILDGVD
jgi:uncharacterized protein (DUF1330 family)